MMIFTFFVFHIIMTTFTLALIQYFEIRDFDIDLWNCLIVSFLWFLVLPALIMMIGSKYMVQRMQRFEHSNINFTKLKRKAGKMYINTNDSKVWTFRADLNDFISDGSIMSAYYPNLLNEYFKAVN